MKRIALVYLAAATMLCGTGATARGEDAQIAENIAALGEANPTRRDTAEQALCAMGPLAQHALEAAANSDDPQIAERASVILWQLRSGISPASPPIFERFLNLLRNGNERQRTAVLEELAGQGVAGMRVLAALAHGTSNPSQRDLILKVMQTRFSEAAALLIADGDDLLAEQVLESAVADQGDAPARDLATMDLCGGNVAAKIKTLKTRLATAKFPGDQFLLAHLELIAGDLPAARVAAQESGDDQLAMDMLLLTGDWSQLAMRLTPGNGFAPSIQLLGYRAGCQQAAGDADGVAKTLGEIEDFADAHPDSDTLKAAAQTLCLNNACDTAVKLLIRHNERDLAAGYLLHRLIFDEAMQLVQAGQNPSRKEEARLRLRSIEIDQCEGKNDLANSQFAAAVKFAEPLDDVRLWARIARIARAGADPNHADEYLARALCAANRGPDIAMILTEAQLPNAALAERWWWFLRPRAADGQMLPAARRVLLLARERAPSALLAELAHEIEPASDVFPNRGTMTALAAQTLVAAGSGGDVEPYMIPRAQELQLPNVYVQLGKVQELLGKWPQAAASYERAWELDRTQAQPLLLEGLALKSYGKSADAQTLIDMAHRLALANDPMRLELLHICEEHHADADAAIERNLLLHLANPHGPERVGILMDAGMQEASKDPDAARISLESAMVEYSAARFTFSDESQLFHFAALLDVLRAQGALHAGLVKNAVEHAQTSLQLEPSPGPEFFQLLDALARAGHTAESDALREQVIAGKSH
jgi:tetratricopeptide (TPR) repeat protein